MKKAEKLLLKDSLVLLQREPFFGNIMMMLDKKITDKIPTAAIGYDPKLERWQLLVNEKFYESLCPEGRTYLLQHELYHVALFHPVRFIEMNLNQREQMLFNIAADGIINIRLIPQISNFIPDGINSSNFPVNMDHKDTTESLYKKLRKLCKDQQVSQSGEGDGDGQEGEEGENNGGGNGQEIIVSDGKGNTQRYKLTDSHKEWDKKNVPKDNQGQYKAFEGMRDIVNGAIKASNNNWGTLSADVVEYIKSNLRSKTNWKKHIRVFGQTSMDTRKGFTYKRHSRRYGEPYPKFSKIQKQVGRLLVGIDVSGSVPIDDQERFYAELIRLKAFTNIDVAFFDGGLVKYVRNWTKKDKIHYTGGGTCPQCVFDLALEHKYKKIVMLTDGEFWDIDTHGIDTLFVITSHGTLRKEGKSVYMEDL